MRHTTGRAATEGGITRFWPTSPSGLQSRSEEALDTSKSSTRFSSCGLGPGGVLLHDQTSCVHRCGGCRCNNTTPVFRVENASPKQETPLALPSPALSLAVAPLRRTHCRYLGNTGEPFVSRL